MIFVDMSAWFASVVPTDPDHVAASRWLRRNREPLLTTDYVVDETLTLLRARGQSARTMALGDEFFRGRLAIVYFLTEADVQTGWEIFCRFADKEWSFTDCTSKAVMDTLRMARAFAFDHHFRQFGSIEVVR